MLETIFVFILGLMPPMLSIWVMQRTKEQAQARLREAMETPVVRVLHRNPLPPEHYYIEGVGYLIGDITCRFNARSAYLRCGVNPCGPCQDCHHYEPKDIDL